MAASWCSSGGPASLQHKSKILLLNFHASSTPMLSVKSSPTSGRPCAFRAPITTPCSTVFDRVPCDARRTTKTPLQAREARDLSRESREIVSASSVSLLGFRHMDQEQCHAAHPPASSSNTSHHSARSALPTPERPPFRSICLQLFQPGPSTVQAERTSLTRSQTCHSGLPRQKASHAH